MIDIFLITMGLLGTFFSIDPHSHRCSECKTKWTHIGLISGGNIHKPRAKLAHTCVCGAQQWDRIKLFKRKCND